MTYTQLTKRAADILGVNTALSSVDLTNIQQDINQALRLFKNASRRYWTRKEVVTNLVASQQYYTFPQDMVRITTVKVISGGLTLPVTLIDSEEMWNRITIIPAMTVGIPTTGFVRGRNELGLFPLPASNVTNGLIVSYEPRMKDMSVDDTSVTVNVTNNSVNVVGTGFTASMVGMSLSVTDGTDGNWYLITGYTSSTAITIENVYLGPTKTGATGIIGSVPDVPEDYHLGMVYFAAYNYFLKRKDSATAADYKALFSDLMQQYMEVYSAKTTGQVQQDVSSAMYNIFNLPPQSIS